MKAKSIILSTLLAMVTIPIVADDEVPALCINQSQGEDQIELAEIGSIKYTEDNMIINFKDGTKQIIPLDEIIVMELGKTLTSVREIAKQASGNINYTITDIQGKVLAKGKSENSKQISMPDKKGVYLLTIGKRTYKILVK